MEGAISNLFYLSMKPFIYASKQIKISIHILFQNWKQVVETPVTAAKAI